VRSGTVVSSHGLSPGGLFMFYITFILAICCMIANVYPFLKAENAQAR
jgi:hypothetical protein